MKRITHSILVLWLISVFIVSSCGASPSTGNGAPNADNLVEFDEQGIAVVQGDINAASTALGEPEVIFLDIPANMDGVDVMIRVPFTVRPETIIGSSAVKQTDVQDYMVFNPGQSAYNAFPNTAWAEITFRKQAGAFEAISILEVTKKFSLFDSKPNITPVFTRTGSQGTLLGYIKQSHRASDGSVLSWLVLTPILVHEIPANVIFFVEPSEDIQAIGPNGNGSAPNEISGSVQIEFTGRGGTLTAKQIRQLP